MKLAIPLAERCHLEREFHNRRIMKLAIPLAEHCHLEREFHNRLAGADQLGSFGSQFGIDAFLEQRIVF